MSAFDTELSPEAKAELAAVFAEMKRRHAPPERRVVQRRRMRGARRPWEVR